MSRPFTRRLTRLALRSSIARWVSLPRRFTGGRSSLSDVERAVNVSFVLHETSTSPPVQYAVAAASSFSSRGRHETPIVVMGDNTIDVSIWLVPSIGDADAIASVLGATARVMPVDNGDVPLRHVQFFRAEAQLTLPDASPCTVGVAALVQRPGYGSRLLISHGPYAWPAEQSAVLRELETIIQAHLEQWQPGAQLWSAPAEQVLGDEVG